MTDNISIVKVNDVDLNLYQVMLLKNALGRIRTPYDRFSISMVANLEDMQDNKLVVMYRNFQYAVTIEGEKWLKEYERTYKTEES